MLNLLMFDVFAQIIHTLLFVTGLTVANPKKGSYWRPPSKTKINRRGKKVSYWRPGTQALREIRHYQKTTNLCIPRLAFLWYVIVSKESKDVRVVNIYNNVQYSTFNRVERVERNRSFSM